MQSPNTPLRNEQLTREQMRTLSGSALDSAALGTMGGTAPVVAQLVSIEINPHLNWGDWLGIAVTRTASAVVAATIIFVSLSAVWFDDTRHVLLTPLPLVVALFVAALVMRLCEEVPALRRVNIWVLGSGIIVTALILIRLFAFGELPAGDWSWLSSYQQLADPSAERPHTEWGMIIISATVWVMGVRLARFAGDYEKQRAAFFGFFVLIIGAIVLATVSVHGIDQTLGASLALALPAYLFVGLLTLSQVRLAELRERLTATGSGDRRSLTAWRLTTVGFAFLSLVSIVVLGIVFYTGTYARFLLAIVAPVIDIVTFILGAILWVLAPLIAFLTPKSTSQQPNKPTCQSLACIAQSKVHELDPATQRSIYIIGIVIIVLIIVVSAFLVLRRLLREGQHDDFEEIQEHLNPRDLRQQAPRASRRGDDASADVPANGTVRAAYRDFLRQSTVAGLPRQSGETAAEFEQRIATALPVPALMAPAAFDVIDDLTQAYQEERYGAITATPGRFMQASAKVLAASRLLPSLRQRVTPPSVPVGDGPDISLERVAWDYRPIVGMILIVAELANLRLFAIIPALHLQGAVEHLIFFVIGVGMITLPIVTVAVGHQSHANKLARWPLATKTLALITLAGGYMLLTATIILGTLILIGAVSSL